jgi:transposase
MAARTEDLLPVEYFHVVFTLPAEIARIAYWNKKAVYGLLFRASAQTVSTIAADPKRLGARVGMTSVLHTWGSALTHHPHVHMIVPGGGLSKGGNRWVACKPGFFLHVRVLSRLFIPAAKESDSLLWFRNFPNSESIRIRNIEECVMGGAIKITWTGMSVSALRCEAKRIKSGRVVRRILAIALVLEGANRTTAARSSGMDRQTLRDWVHRYNASGIAGLYDLGGRGAKPRLSLKQQTQFVGWVEAGPNLEKDGVVRWRCSDLKARVEGEFGVKLHVRTIGRYLNIHGFRRLCVRPEHPKTDAAAQEAFKKTLQVL